MVLGVSIRDRRLIKLGGRTPVPPAPAESGNDEFTVVMLHMDGSEASTSILDTNAGGSAKTWTAVGNAQLDAADPHFGSASLLLDGAGDCISTPDHADFSFGADPFTIDCWFNRAGGNGTFRFIAHKQHNTSPFAAFQMYLTTTNTLRFVGNFPNLGDRTVNGTTAFTSPGWNHVEAVRNGPDLLLFVNGILEGSISTLSNEAIRDGDGLLRVGADFDGASGYWNGAIDEFRISKGIARHTANFTPPTAAYGPG